jgi:hypothetical protein
MAIRKKGIRGEATGTPYCETKDFPLDKRRQTAFQFWLRPKAALGHLPCGKCWMTWVFTSLGFYTLRHVFLTIAEESRDHIAVAHDMGHVVPGMGTAYREKVSDERLRAVCEYVRVWLFGKAKRPKPR